MLFFELLCYTILGMAILKETSFWGKWKRKKELKPEKKVLLGMEPAWMSGSPTPSWAAYVLVDSDKDVKYIGKNESEIIAIPFSGNDINGADLKTRGPLSILGIISRVIYQK